MPHQLRVPRAMLVSSVTMLPETSMVFNGKSAAGERPGSRLAAGHRAAVALTRVDRRARLRRRRRDAGEACGQPPDDRGRLAPFPGTGKGGGMGWSLAVNLLSCPRLG